MCSTKNAAGRPAWLLALVWSIAIVLAFVGTVLAIASGSVWPLVAFAGLAVPMMPIGSRRSSRQGAAGTR
ncbi:MAG TPA: hypothetical protein PKH61_02065 [Microbacteriaceae bacterium]|nr:hypothetical protein [Microbacteriaceae bacterium]